MTVVVAPKGIGTKERALRLGVIFARLALSWPEGRESPVLKFIGWWILPLCFVCVVPFNALMFVLFNEFSNVAQPMQAIGDLVASTVCVSKMVCLSRNENKLLSMRLFLETAFEPLERGVRSVADRENAACSALATRVGLHFLVWAYLPITLSSLVMVLWEATTHGPCTRKLPINTLPFITEHDFTFWTLFFLIFFTLYAFVISSCGFDVMFSSLCLHISTKCKILQIMLLRAGANHQTSQLRASQDMNTSNHRKKYDFEYWKDDGTPETSVTEQLLPEDTEAFMRECVKYHQCIIKLRDDMESVFTSVILGQMFYTLVALGVPAVRLLHETADSLSEVSYILSYAIWTFFQLLFYCWFGDMVAKSSVEVSVAAYAAFRPDRPTQERGLSLPLAPARMLQMLTMRAQKPLFITAGHFTNLTLQLYLEIIRRSQSFYSAILRLR